MTTASVNVRIDLAELTVRMVEAAYQIDRPANMTAAEAMESMDADVRDRWVRAAKVASEFVAAAVSAQLTERYSKKEDPQ